MPHQEQSTNIYTLGAFDAEEMLRDLREHRERLILAWRERGVMLTREEQDRLREEITETCQLLSGLSAD